MCNVNPGSSCVPPRRSLCAPVRPTVSFPGKVDNLFFIYLFSNRLPWTSRCRRVPSKSRYKCCLLKLGFRSPVVESSEPPGVGTADGDGVHCSLLDITHVCLILSLLRALILRQCQGQQQVFPSAARIRNAFPPHSTTQDRHDEQSRGTVD